MAHKVFEGTQLSKCEISFHEREQRNQEEISRVRIIRGAVFESSHVIAFISFTVVIVRDHGANEIGVII